MNKYLVIIIFNMFFTAVVYANECDPAYDFSHTSHFQFGDKLVPLLDRYIVKPNDKVHLFAVSRDCKTPNRQTVFIIDLTSCMFCNESSQELESHGFEILFSGKNDSYNSRLLKIKGKYILSIWYQTRALMIEDQEYNYLTHVMSIFGFKIEEI